MLASCLESCWPLAQNHAGFLPKIMLPSFPESCWPLAQNHADQSPALNYPGVLLWIILASCPESCWPLALNYPGLLLWIILTSCPESCWPLAKNHADLLPWIILPSCPESCLNPIKCGFSIWAHYLLTAWDTEYSNLGVHGLNIIWIHIIACCQTEGGKEDSKVDKEKEKAVGTEKSDAKGKDAKKDGKEKGRTIQKRCLLTSFSYWPHSYNCIIIIMLIYSYH